MIARGGRRWPEQSRPGPYRGFVGLTVRIAIAGLPATLDCGAAMAGVVTAGVVAVVCFRRRVRQSPLPMDLLGSEAGVNETGRGLALRGVGRGGN